MKRQSWYRQEFKGFGEKGRIDGRWWNRCRMGCPARMELKWDSKGVKYLKHPTGAYSDAAHLGLPPFSGWGRFRTQLLKEEIG